MIALARTELANANVVFWKREGSMVPSQPMSLAWLVHADGGEQSCLIVILTASSSFP